MRAILIGILIFIGLWVLYMSVGFFLVWGPPVFAMCVCFTIPTIQTRVAAIYLKKYGIGSWATDRAQIDDNLKGPGLIVIIALSLALLLFAWVGIAGYPALSLGLKFKDADLQSYFMGQTERARSIRFLFTVLPCGLLLVGLIPCIRFLIVRRIEKIAARLGGSDSKTEALRTLDADITACLREMGSQRRSRYAAELQTWRSAHIRDVIHYSTAYKLEFDRVNDSAKTELARIARCYTQFRDVRDEYQRGLVRLRRTASVALLASLEDAGRTLLSDAFVHLVDTGRWKDIETFLQDVKAELVRLNTVTDEWTGTQTEKPSASTARMTPDKALKILALPKSCSREDIERRRKEMAKIHHPDRAGTDDDLRKHNQETMKEINEACDLLLQAS